MNTTLIIIISATVFIAIIITAMYNGLIRRRNEVDNAFGGMDVQLKKRYDLIPNLVATVKQYAAHEKELLAKVTEMRAKATNGNLSADEKVALDNQISAARRTYNAVITDYNNGIQTYPQSILVGMMKMTKKEVFVIPETEGQNVDVKSLF